MLAWFVEVQQESFGFDGAYLRQCFREAGVDIPRYGRNIFPGWRPRNLRN